MLDFCASKRRCYSYAMFPHDGRDPRRDRNTNANAWIETRILLIVISILMGVIVGVLMKRLGY